MLDHLMVDLATQEASRGNSLTLRVERRGKSKCLAVEFSAARILSPTTVASTKVRTSPMKRLGSKASRPTRSRLRSKAKSLRAFASTRSRPQVWTSGALRDGPRLGQLGGGHLAHPLGGLHELEQERMAGQLADGSAGDSVSCSEPVMSLL